MEQFYSSMDLFIRGVPSEYSRHVNKEVVNIMTDIYWKDASEIDVMRSILDYFTETFPERTEDLIDMESLWQKRIENI